MSNCINLMDHTVVFTNEEINIPELLKLQEEHKDHKRRPEIQDWWCWFLKDNTVITPDKVTIKFGTGQSSHTWRDFKYVVWELNKFILKPKTHIFQATDEFDGHDQVFNIIIHWPYSSKEDVFKIW